MKIIVLEVTMLHVLMNLIVKTFHQDATITSSIQVHSIFISSTLNTFSWEATVRHGNEGFFASVLYQVFYQEF